FDRARGDRLALERVRNRMGELLVMLGARQRIGALPTSAERTQVSPVVDHLAAVPTALTRAHDRREGPRSLDVLRALRAHRRAAGALLRVVSVAALGHGDRAVALAIGGLAAPRAWRELGLLARHCSALRDPRAQRPRTVADGDLEPATARVLSLEDCRLQGPHGDAEGQRARDNHRVDCADQRTAGMPRGKPAWPRGIGLFLDGGCLDGVAVLSGGAVLDAGEPGTELARVVDLDLDAHAFACSCPSCQPASSQSDHTIVPCCSSNGLVVKPSATATSRLTGSRVERRPSPSGGAPARRRALT